MLDHLGAQRRRQRLDELRHDHLRIVGSVQERLEMRRARRLEPGPGIRTRSLECVVDRSLDVRDARRVYCEDDLLLGLEVVVHRARQHADRGRDVAHGGSDEALGAEEPGRGIEQGLAAIVARRPRAAPGGRRPVLGGCSSRHVTPALELFGVMYTDRDGIYEGQK